MIPTSHDVVNYLNERFAARGIDIRIESISVLPYMNPMWMANWEIPQLSASPNQEIIEEEIREARWRFPQVTQEF